MFLLVLSSKASIFFYSNFFIYKMLRKTLKTDNFFYIKDGFKNLLYKNYFKIT